MVRNEVLTTTAYLSCLLFCAFATQRIQRRFSSTCIGHSSRINGKEYKLFNKKAQYDQAKAQCKSWGLTHGSSNARLAIIPNKKTQKCLKNMIRSPGNYQAQKWININPFFKGYFVGGNDLYREKTWKWEDETHIPTRQGGIGYQNWGPYEPNNVHEEDCMSLLITPVPHIKRYRLAKWVDVSCQSSLFYICERDLPIPLHRNQTNQQHKACIGHSSNINGKEYKLFNKKAQYDQAKAQCKSWGLTHGSSNARLAIIPNKKTQKCLKNMIRSPGNYQAQEWININPFFKGYFVGGNDLHREIAWKWEDGTHIPTRQGDIGYQNWGPYEPNNVHEEDCMSLLITPVPHIKRYRLAKWVDVSCQSSLFYICERDLPISLLPNQVSQQHKLNHSRKQESCGLQSPINIDINEDQACTGNTVGQIEWGSDSDNVLWRIHNTGSQVHIRTQPEKSTYVRFNGNPEKFYIDYAAIKFGSSRNTGSEHMINGEHYAGELQIICLPLQPKGEIHALSFMIQERSFRANSHWTLFINRIGMVQESGLSASMAVPVGHFKHLLGESQRGYTHTEKDYHTNAGIRYRGTLTSLPCTLNVIWTVYPRALSLSTAQFAPIRHVHTASGDLMSESTTPLEIGNSQCRILF